MDCACTVDMDIDDRCEMITRRFIKARKPHVCSECHCLVSPPDEYFREVTVYDGHMQTYKTCEDCYSIRQVFFSSGWYYEQLLEDLQEFIIDCYGEVSVPCLLQLTPRARGMVCDIIEAYWEDNDEEIDEV